MFKWIIINLIYLKKYFFIKKIWNLNKNKYNLAKKAIISVIIPVFNCQKSIRASIRSIQNQYFRNCKWLFER